MFMSWLEIELGNRLLEFGGRLRNWYAVPKWRAPGGDNADYMSIKEKAVQPLALDPFAGDPCPPRRNVGADKCYSGMDIEGDSSLLSRVGLH